MESAVLPDLIPLALRRHAVRPTRIRHLVLELLARSPFAQSSAELEQQLPASADRITLYRTLRTFEAKGLVHRIIDHSETVRYAPACLEPPAADHIVDHVHFKCSACQHIYCLRQVPVPAVTLPGHYRIERRECLLLGVCPQCRAPAN